MKGGRLRAYLFEKNLGIFKLVTVPLETPEKTKLHPWKFHETVLHPLEIPTVQGQKLRPTEIAHDFTTCFFFNTSQESPCSQTPCCFNSFWNSSLSCSQSCAADDLR